MANIVFNVPIGPVNVRDNPSLKAKKVAELSANTVVDVVDNSRTEAEGYVWWRHSLGWSAERTLDGKNILMVAITDFFKGETPPKPVLVPDPKPITTKKQFRTLRNLNVRDRPALSGTLVGSPLPIGTVINVFADSRTEADGLLWWRHAIGWSAEKSLNASIVYMVEPDQPPLNPPDGGTTPTPTPVFGIPGDVLDVSVLPSLNSLVVRYPLDLSQTQWLQYFGNTQFAFTDGTQWGYDGYAQGLHSGVDFGRNPPDTPVFAGVTGNFVRFDRFGIRIRAGNYIVIYQHVNLARSFAPNEPITPDTVVGVLDPSFGTNTHLHFEIRRTGEAHILNPLYFMIPALRDPILNRFKPYTAHFFKNDRWTQWQTPLEQPVIVLGGRVIGPKA